MNKQATILVVDDEPVGRKFIADQLSQHYDVKEADSGDAAFQMIEDSGLPDLILLDVCMPDMDGFEACRRLKQQSDTRHIPIIFLTAKTSDEDEEKGLHAGAVDFLKKPFRPGVDLKRISIHLLLAQGTVKSEAIKQSEKQSFEQKITTLILNNIGDSKYSVECLAHDMCMSRETLARNCKKTMDLSPLAVIRQIRMQQAALRLKNGDATVTEVCYALGYESLSYFSKVFKQYSGMTPSDYSEACQSN